jgi:hypothetical protein
MCVGAVLVLLHRNKMQWPQRGTWSTRHHIVLDLSGFFLQLLRLELGRGLG